MNTSMYNQYSRLIIIVMIVVFAMSCNNEGEESQSTEEPPVQQPVQPSQEVIPVLLVNQYPHMVSAYTEGLQFVDGLMYESTGQYGRSYLYKYELGTGKVISEYKLENKYFGEGMTVMGDIIYMLTYREHTGFMFDKNTFKLLGKFPVRTNEGWGLTNDSTHLIYGDGTAGLYFLDAKTKEEVKRLQVTDRYGPVVNINELEYINGYIYANKYETELILKIDPNTGKVVGQADLRRIRAQAGVAPSSHISGQPEVMNGIAYDKENNRIYITGKNWPKILEVKLDN